MQLSMNNLKMCHEGDLTLAPEDRHPGDGPFGHLLRDARISPAPLVSLMCEKQGHKRTLERVSLMTPVFLLHTLAMGDPGGRHKCQQPKNQQVPPAAHILGRPGGQSAAWWGIPAPRLTAATTKDPRFLPLCWERYGDSGHPGEVPSSDPQVVPQGGGVGAPRRDTCAAQEGIRSGDADRPLRVPPNLGHPPDHDRCRSHWGSEQRATPAGTAQSGLWGTSRGATQHPREGPSPRDGENQEAPRQGSTGLAGQSPREQVKLRAAKPAPSRFPGWGRWGGSPCGGRRCHALRQTLRAPRHSPHCVRARPPCSVLSSPCTGPDILLTLFL